MKKLIILMMCALASVYHPGYQGTLEDASSNYDGYEQQGPQIEQNKTDQGGPGTPDSPKPDDAPVEAQRQEPPEAEVPEAAEAGGADASKDTASEDFQSANSESPRDTIAGGADADAAEGPAPAKPVDMAMREAATKIQRQYRGRQLAQVGSDSTQQILQMVTNGLSRQAEKERAGADDVNSDTEEQTPPATPREQAAVVEAEVARRAATEAGAAQTPPATPRAPAPAPAPAPAADTAGAQRAATAELMRKFTGYASQVITWCNAERKYPEGSIEKSLIDNILKKAGNATSLLQRDNPTDGQMFVGISNLMEALGLVRHWKEEYRLFRQIISKTVLEEDYSKVSKAWNAIRGIGPQYLQMYNKAQSQISDANKTKVYVGLLKLYLERDQTQEDIDKLKNEILELLKTSVGTEVETLRSEVASTSIGSVGRNTVGEVAKALHEQGVIKI